MSLPWQVHCDDEMRLCDMWHTGDSLGLGCLQGVYKFFLGHLVGGLGFGLLQLFIWLCQSIMQFGASDPN